jgi:VWFA-related protein
VDLFNTLQSEYLNIRPSIEEFVNQVTGNGWSVMVSGLTTKGKLVVMLQYTKNSDRVKAVLSGLQANTRRDLIILRNERELLDLLESGLPQAKSQAFRLAKTYARQEKQLSRYSLEAMEAFANYLHGFHQREHLVILFISGGFNSDPGRHYHDALIRITGIEPDATTFPEAVRETDFDIVKEVQDSIGRLNRMDMTVYTINTRGMNVIGTTQFRDNEFAQDYQDSLAQIADETGGLFFQNSNNFKLGFDRVLNDLDHQYLLCYDPPKHMPSGKYHRIRVVVKKPGIQLRHRQGYVD